MVISFRDLLRSMGNIHVSTGGDFGENAKIVILEPDPFDLDRAELSFELSEGNGMLENPYRLRVSSASPHYAVVRLWRQSLPDDFIMVNDWIMKVTRDGVIAKDGTLTVIGKPIKKASEQA